MRSAYRILQIAFHGILLFVLPLVVGAMTSFFADVLEVKETLSGLLAFSGAVFVPLVIVQLVGVGAKLRRGLAEAAQLAAVGRGQPTLEVCLRHVRVLAPRGVSLLFMSLLAVVMALSVRWAQFGIMAVLGLALVYLAAAVGTIVSAFLVRDLGEGVRRRGGTLNRQFVPAVVDAGAEVEERLSLESVPIPPGFRLLVHEVLPERFGCESRFVVERESAGRALTVSARLRRTPRGDHKLGPARIWLEDLLGLTRVELAHAMTADLRVLPRARNVMLDDPPRASAVGEGPLTILRKQPTEDLFRFRDYLPTDDPRRIHWKLSARVGRMQVRVPETVPVARRKIRLVLDTQAPAALLARPEAAHVLADLLDAAVEAWVSMARALVQRGERVTLAFVPPGGVVVEVPCARGMERAWRSEAARAAWQTTVGLAEAVAAGPRDTGAVVVTPALVAPGRLNRPVAWVLVPSARYLAPGAAVEAGPRGTFFKLAFPAGADENSLGATLARRRNSKRRKDARTRAAAEAQLAGDAALSHIQAAGDPRFRIEPRGAGLILVSA